MLFLPMIDPKRNNYGKFKGAYRPIDIDRYHTLFHLREDEEKDYILTDVLEIHFIELPKFRKVRPDFDKPIDRWLLFIDGSSEEVLEVIKEKDQEIKKAEDVLEFIGTNEEMIRYYELREKAIRDETSMINGAMREGMEKGRVAAIRDTAIKLLTKKFGPLPEDIITGISESDAGTIETIVENIFEFNSLGDVKKYIS